MRCSRVVAPLKELALREGLGRLVEAELVYQRGLPPKATYTFKHALVQDTAYQSLLESQRRELHGRIADALREAFPRARRPRARGDRAPLRRGGTHGAGDRPLPARGRAREPGVGERGGNRPSPAERSSCSGRSPRRASEIGRSWGSRWRSAGPWALRPGWAHPECEGAFDRARALASQIGEAPERARVLAGLALSVSGRVTSRLPSSWRAQALEAAERTGDAFDLLSAHTAAGSALFFQGEFSRSLHHLRTGHRPLRLQQACAPCAHDGEGPGRRLPQLGSLVSHSSSAIPTGGWR